MSKDFIYIDEYGLKGSNYYWRTCSRYNITPEELAHVGLLSERVQIHPDILNPLLNAEKEILNHGYTLYIKEGYRSPELYRLVYEKRVVQYGKEETDRLINITDMPHASGKTVDVTLWDPQADIEIQMRNKDEDPDALFIDFYKDRTDKEGKEYQRLQTLLISIMLNNGFEIGIKREYFHFNYKT